MIFRPLNEDLHDTIPQLGLCGLGEELFWVIPYELTLNEIIIWADRFKGQLEGEYTVRRISVGFTNKKDAALFALSFK